MCVKIIDWVNYYMKIIYSVTQYMHLNVPRTTCLCIDTCYSKQTTIPPECFATVTLLQLVQCRRGIVTAQFILAKKLTSNRKPDHSFTHLVVLTA